MGDWLINFYSELDILDITNLPIGFTEKENLLKACAHARGYKDGNRLATLVTCTSNRFNVYFYENKSQWIAWLEACLQLGVDDKQLKANVLQAIGDVQQFRKENDAALESYNEALKLFKAVGAKLGEANVRKAIGDVQQFRKENDAALESYNEALKLFKAVGDRLGEANVYLSLGGSKRENKDIAGAKIDYDNALKIYKIIGDQYSQARALYRLGDCSADDEKYSDAVKFYDQAKQLWSSIEVNDLIESILVPRIEEAKKHL